MMCGVSPQVRIYTYTRGARCAITGQTKAANSANVFICSGGGIIITHPGTGTITRTSMCYTSALAIASGNKTKDREREMETKIDCAPCPERKKSPKLMTQIKSTS
jgi:hypothetical protein